MGSDRTAKGAVVLSTAAAITAAFALMKKTQAAPGNGNGTPELPDELWNLIIAIAQSADHVDLDMDTLIAEIKKISVNVQGWPSNCDALQTVRVVCGVAATAAQLPDMPIPDGFTLAVKAWPTNVGLIYVGEDQSASTNINRAYPLARGDLVTLGIRNANVVWISATAAGDAISLVAERRKAV